jgi:hypothetical protein
VTQAGYPFGPEPWWVSVDRDAERQEPPIMEAPCPCCYGNGHEHSCSFAIDLSIAQLSRLLGRPLPDGWLGGAAWPATDPLAEELTVSCQRCMDAGTVPCDGQGMPL